jgi:hypothetical protein
LEVTLLEAVSRRLELLRLEGIGLTQKEIVKQISQKMSCSERSVYNDLECRSSWQPLLQGLSKPDDLLLKIVNRYEEIYRQASRRILTSPSDLTQIAALNTIMKANSLMFETAVMPELMYKIKMLEDKVKKGVFVP